MFTNCSNSSEFTSSARKHPPNTPNMVRTAPKNVRVIARVQSKQEIAPVIRRFLIYALLVVSDGAIKPFNNWGFSSSKERWTVNYISWVFIVFVGVSDSRMITQRSESTSESRGNDHRCPG